MIGAPATLGDELQGSESRFKAWMDERMRLLQEDRDEVIVVSGDERSGKSTLAFHMALYMDPHFDPATNVCFTGSAYTRTSARLGRRRVIILDESIAGGFSRDSGSQENKELIKYLTVAGERNQIHILLWPNIRWLDKALKEHRARWNIHVKARRADHAVAMVRLLKEGEYVYDPPKNCFPFRYPAASGPLWEKYRTSKSRFVTDTGRGTDDGLVTAREDLLDRQRTALRPFLTEIYARP